MKLQFNDYLLLNREGIFPGPKEAAEDFCSRVSKLRVPITLPGLALTQKEWDAAHGITKRIFDIEPTWVPAFYWNKKIAFWEAAAAWDCEGRAVVQLRKQLANGRWIFIEQGEVLAHEAAHAARMTFLKNRFEEIICYQTSRSSWRRWFGPLFRTPWEASLCIGALAIGWLCSLIGMWAVALIVPWLPFIFFLLRLLYDQHLFKHCLLNVRSLLMDPSRAQAVILRLTDDEIVYFARASRNDIEDYVGQQSEKEFRWKIIRDAYFCE